jgi:serine/threonine protein kinase
MSNQSETVVPENQETVGTSPAMTTDEIIGMTIADRYLVEKRIGAGGFGAVYLALDLELLSKPVVVKLLNEKSLKNEWVVGKFLHEIEALVRIDHPSVVQVFASGKMQDGNPFIVMEYIEGISLRSIMEKSLTGMDFERVAKLIHQLGHALTAAHDKGIIHRDLKPENILIRTLNDRSEQVKIIDFGIAKVKDSRLAPSTVNAEIVGTIVYMAPEQLNARPVSGATDTYSLGAIAYEMLTGRRPFNPDTAFQLAEIQRGGVKIRPSDLRSSISPKVDAVIMQALAYIPEKRYLSAAAFTDELVAALTDSNTFETTTVFHTARTLPLPVKAVVAHSNRNYAFIAGGILLVLLAGVAGFAPRLGRWLHNDKPAETKPAVVSPMANVEPNLSIDYFLMVQKYLPNGTRLQQPFKATGNATLADGWQFTINPSSPQVGFLYIVNEGPAVDSKTTYNLLYPIPKFNSGSAEVVPGTTTEIGPYQLDSNQGSEKLWLVWSEKPVAEFEAVKGVVNSKDKGSISDPNQAEAIRRFLSNTGNTKLEKEIDKVNKVVHLRAVGDVLATPIEIEHQ